MRLAWIVAGLLAWVSAHAEPVQITWQGRLLDAAGGPLNGPVALEVALMGSATGADERWSDTYDVTAMDGYVTVTLGSDIELPSSALARPVWVEPRIDDQPLGARSELTSVPHAAVASSVPISVTPDNDACDGREGDITWDPELAALRVCDGSHWLSVTPFVPVDRYFLNCNANGRYGPTQAQCDAYFGRRLYEIVDGYQRWTVESTGQYLIEALGAQGGSVGNGTGGRGAYVWARVDLQRGDELIVVAGQPSTNKPCDDWGAGGGGGSFVAKVVATGGEVLSVTGDRVIPLVVAGGGAGNWDNAGGCSQVSAGGQGLGGNGSGGTGGNAGGGGGWRTDGTGTSGSQGRAFLGGAVGGTRNSNMPVGGFGGGGGPYDGGGAGGGWSGGTADNAAATGGTSYVYNTGRGGAQPNQRAGRGYVRIRNTW